MIDRQKLAQEMAKIADDLEFDRLRRWNDPPLNHGMLERFEHLLRELEAIVVTKPSLYPTEEGEARAEWSKAPWEVSVTALAEAAIFHVEMLNLQTDEWREHNFELSDLDKIKNLLTETLVGVNNAGE